ncbi:MAG: hypothetical protein PHH04_05370 [Thomasclavelia sp.]|nr:hypothetical protein [Thomasclavelia sp.]
MNDKQLKAASIAHELAVYDDSEQADQKDNDFDKLWQSIYDVCFLISNGILDDLTDEEFKEGKEWLINNQSLTKDYKDKEIEF